jgi:hypothetical protein
MSQWAGRKEQSLAMRALWRFGPAVAAAGLLAMPSVHGSAHSHGPSPAHRSGGGPVSASSSHSHADRGPATVSAGATGPARVRPPVRPHRAGYFIKPD